jgi:LysR family transcriptional regulator for bpeEF and oprC
MGEKKTGLVLEGGGIGIAVPRYLVESELETGDLIEVLPDWQIEPEVMWLLRPQSRFPSDAGQKLARWFRKEASENPSLTVSERLNVFGKPAPTDLLRRDL